MTSRRTGKRIAAAAGRKRVAKQTGVKRSARRKEAVRKPGERRLLVQLVLCGGVFVLLVAVKLLLPTRMEQFQVRLDDAMERNMDVKAVFSAVGRAFSGESEILSAANEVYQAVFQQEEAVEASGQATIAESEMGLNLLQDYRPTEEVSSEEETEQAAASTLSYILYSDQNLPEGVSMEQAILGFDYCVPVEGTLSSEFGYREHPVAGEEKFHYGIDLVADQGTPVACFADGTITAVGESSSYGKYCIVAHENGYSTLYAHCNRITAASGDTVGRGEQIAEVGATGMVTGAHLHFELQRDGTYLNPIYYVAGI